FIGDLPDDVLPDEVKRSAEMLGSLFEHGTFDELPKPKRNEKNGPLAQVVALLSAHPEVHEALIATMAKRMRAVGKTKSVTTIKWSGGGGFDFAQVAPSMFEADGGRLFLAEWAAGGALAEAVAAQL